MASLIGGIDPSKALPQGELGQTPRLLLLPGGPVQEAWHLNAIDQQGMVGHLISGSRLVGLVETKDSW